MGRQTDMLIYILKEVKPSGLVILPTRTTEKKQTSKNQYQALESSL